MRHHSRLHDFCLEHICQALASGATWLELARVYGCNHTTVRGFFYYRTDPNYREYRKRISRTVQAKRKAKGLKKPATPEQRQRWHLRAMARAEARATGIPVEEIYERWEVA